jgi:uncharacterized delta-60 repeat protein
VTVGGVQGIYLRRYDADGSLDSSFAPGLGYGGASGYVFIAAPSQFSYGSPDVIRLILDSSGRILMGAANYGLFRLNPSGTFDTGFGIGGFVAVTGLLDFTLAPNGQIVTTSGTDTVSRFNTNGSVDTTFGSGGSVSVPTSSGPVAVQPNEEILVGGSQSDPDTGYFGGSTNDLAVTRLNVNGSVDTTFGTAGTSTANYNKFDPDDDLENYSEVLSLTVLPNGNILAGGGAQQQAADGQTGLTAAEFLPNGKIDTAFASGGEIAPYFVGDSFYYQGFTLASTIVQPNGSIVFSGGFTDDSGTGFYVIRFTAAGIADSSFGSDGEVTMQFGEPSTQGANPDDYILSAAAAPRGNLIVVGNAPDPSTSDGSGIALARYNLGLGTVVGTVFNDSNGDGIRESGETGIAGQTVYADLAGTGSYQYGDPETITDSNGNYTLSGLPLGPLVIRQILLSGQRQSFPMGIGEHVTLGANAVTNVNFGTTTDVYVSGDVFNDANLNGKQDSTETGIGGWRVFADLNNDDKFESSEPSALTNSNGTFYFTDLAAGTYVFRVLPASGWHQTYPTDSFGQHVTLASGGISPWVHFGFAQNAVPSASISGSVFDDLNDNGKQNTGEAGLEGWTVYLDLSNSGSLTGNDPVTKTDANGDFSFMGLSAGNYIVRVIRPAGWTQTTPSNNFGWHITLAAHGAATGLLFGEHQ